MHPIVTLLQRARAERQALLDEVLTEYPELDYGLEPEFVAVLMSPRQKALWTTIGHNLAELERYAHSLGIDIG